MIGKPEEKSNVCKHGINPITCGLCLGLPQTVEKASGPPNWLADVENLNEIDEDDLIGMEGIDEDE